MRGSVVRLLARLWTSAALAGVLLLAGTQVQAQTSPTCEAIGGTCRPITQDGICESGEQLDHSGTCDSNLKCCAEALCENRGGACQPNVTTCAPGTSSLGNAACSTGRCCTLPTDGPTCGELVGTAGGQCSQTSDSCPDNYTNLGPTKDPCLSCCSPAPGPGPTPTPTPGGSEYKVEFLHTDALGSVRMVTDQTGAVVSRSDYYPFGTKIDAGDTARDAVDATYLDDPALRQRFTGKERDGESQMDYFGARYYVASLGRFASADIPFADQHLDRPQSWNLYTYVLNDPENLVDETGRGTAGKVVKFIIKGGDLASTFEDVGVQLAVVASTDVRVGVGVRLAAVAVGVWDLSPGSDVVEGGRLAGRALGRAGKGLERSVELFTGLSKNNRMVDEIRGRIPDFVGRVKKLGAIVGEAKDTKYQYLSSQLKDTLAFAQESGARAVLFISEKTKLSSPLVKAFLEQKGRVYREVDGVMVDITAALSKAMR